MFLLKKLLSALALPPLSLILLALLGLVLTRRHPRTGRWLAGLSLLSLAMLSVPAVSIVLMRSLETHPPIQAAPLARVQAIVVLGGGVYYSAPEYGDDTVGRHSLERIRYAAHLHKDRPADPCQRRCAFRRAIGSRNHAGSARTGFRQQSPLDRKTFERHR